MKRKLLIVFVWMFAGISMHAQTFTTVATGLLYPAGVTMDSAGNIFVAEAGTGNNDGRISMIHSGIRYTVIDSLPSVFDTVIQDIVGTWRCYVDSGMLTVIVGGKSEVNMGSIITFDISSYVAGGPYQTIADATGIFHVASWALSNGFTDSDIFSAAWDSSGNTYISDAGANAIFKRDAVSNMLSVVNTFPSILNTITPFPPFIDYVPTKIINGNNGNFYISNLTGFPFLPGLASIVSVDSSGIVDTLVANGLTLAVDMQSDSIGNGLYVLQFGRFDTNFVPMANSAMILHVDTAGMIDTVATGFGPSAGMVSDSAGGFYATEIYNGTLIHIQLATAIHNPVADGNNISVYPNPFSGELTIRIDLALPSDFSYEVHDVAGSLVYQSKVSELPHGIHSISWNATDDQGTHVKKGMYFLSVKIGAQRYNFKMISL
jgi:hypothetical protein